MQLGDCFIKIKYDNFYDDCFLKTRYDNLLQVTFDQDDVNKILYVVEEDILLTCSSYILNFIFLRIANQV